MRPLDGASAVVFDLDGVLWDTSAAHAAALEATLAPLGVPIPTYAELAGRRTDEVVAALLRAAGREPAPGLVHELTEAKRRRALALLSERPPIAPSTPQLLRRLAATRRLALASSASGRSVELFLAASEAHDLFQVVLCADDLLAPKPAPDIFLRAVERLGAPAREVVVVEDSPAGVRAARAAGLRVVGLVGTVSAGRLQTEGATEVVESLEELLT